MSLTNGCNRPSTRYTLSESLFTLRRLGGVNPFKKQSRGVLSMSDYEIIMQLYFYDIMAVCEAGGCADFHRFYCWQNSSCFYDSMYQSAISSLDMGWY